RGVGQIAGIPALPWAYSGSGRTPPMVVSRALLVLFLLVPLARAEGEPSAQTRSLAETEALAREDLARSLRVDPADIQLVRSSPRTWPDETLGCAARKGLAEPRPLAGYEVVLGHEEERYTYRADRQGHLRRCEKPAKPIDRFGR